jgi:hypothetical protein
MKNVATIKCLRKENDIQKNKIILHKTEVKMLVEDRNQLREEKRTLVKAFHAWLKVVD